MEVYSGVKTILKCGLLLSLSNVALAKKQKQKTAEQPMKIEAPHNAIHSHTFSPLWQSPAQLYDVSRTSHALMFGYRNDQQVIQSEQSDRGYSNSSTSPVVDMQVVSRFPSSAPGRLGLRFTFQEDMQSWQSFESLQGGGRVLGSDTVLTEQRVMVLQPTLAYTFWDVLAVGVGVRSERIMQRHRTLQSTDVQNLLSGRWGVSVFGQSWDFGVDGGVSLDPILSQPSETNIVSELGQQSFSAATLRWRVDYNWLIGGRWQQTQSSLQSSQSQQMLGTIAYKNWSSVLEVFAGSVVDTNAATVADVVQMQRGFRYGVSFMAQLDHYSSLGLMGYLDSGQQEIEQRLGLNVFPASTMRQEQAFTALMLNLNMN